MVGERKMMNLSDRERKAKLDAIRIVLVDAFWEGRFPVDFNEQSENVLKAIEQVEIEFDNQYFEARQANSN